MHEHGHVGVEQRAVHEVVDPDRRAAVPDQHDRFEPAFSEDGVGERKAGGERGRAPVRCVDRVRADDLAVGQPDAADVGDDGDVGGRDSEAAERLAERAQDEWVPAALAVRAAAGLEVTRLHQPAASIAASIRAGVTIAPTALTRTSRRPSRCGSSTPA